MFLFPLLYCLSFIYSFINILKGKLSAVFIFLIFGLSIYTTSLSISFGLGFENLIPLLQSFKEIIILIVFSITIYHANLKMKLHLVDYFILTYFAYTFLYVIFPIGEYSVMERLLAFKSTSFFVIIYSTGRLLSLKEIQISKYFHFILLVTIGAAIVVSYEFFTGEHFQAITNYAEYNLYFFNYEPEGNYGLTWTFEIEGGKKRFASFFSDPLEHAASTLLALAVIASLYTTDHNNLKLNTFGKFALAASFISIILALSRASFVSYFLVIYAFAVITKKRTLLKIYHYPFLAVCLYFIFILKDKDIYEYIIDTITFENASSIGHIIEWLAGIQAIYENPLGAGLGTSGKVANVLGENIGGENQFIIIGVQTGVVSIILYLGIHIILLSKTIQWFPKLKGKAKQIALMLFLLKIGIIIPLLTTNFESYSYINYIGWLISGIFISQILDASSIAHETYSKELES